MCARCDELEEEVAYLRSELGLQVEAESVARIRSHLRDRSGGYRSNGGTGASLVAALYAARGRTLSKLQILDAVPSPSGLEDRNPKIVDVWVYVARRGLGREAIETVWGQGYRLTVPGMALIGAIINPQKEAA